MHWIKQCPVPIYLTQAFPENPMARAYPIESITSFFHFVCGRPPVFASSFAYAIALAIYLGFEEIGLYGCDLDWGRERAVEHGNLAFWAGLAMGRGVTITIPEKSAFLAHPARYGFDYDLEKAEIEKRCARLIFELLWNPAIAEQYEKYAYRWNHGGRDAVQSELWGSMEDLIVKQEAVG
jgi:hypothetical protein